MFAHNAILVMSATNKCEAHTLKEVKESGEKIYSAFCDVCR